MVIRFQSDQLDDSSHNLDVGCIATNSFVQLTMPILTGVITIGLLASQFTYLRADDCLTIGTTFSVCQLVCAVMFFSSGLKRVRNLTVMTVQTFSDFAKDCLLGALLYWILFLPPIIIPILSAAFTTKHHLAVQSVLVLIYICATRIPVQVAQSAK